MTTRRRLLLGVAAGTAGIAGAGIWRYFGASDAEVIAVILRKRLDYLRLDPIGVAAFARELSARDIVGDRPLHLVGMLEPLYVRVPFPGDNPLSDRIRHGEERIVTMFLLSSDFFRNGADETRMVHYLSFYDPLRQPCATPFSRLTPPALREL